MLIKQPSIELLWITENCEKQIEAAGRTCYKSESKITDDSAGDFTNRMVKSGHHAMIEHASASFKIITDRGITHEIVRHRLASYAQESTRYCNYSNGKFGKQCTFICPPSLAPDQLETWASACRYAEMAYFKLLELGSTPQVARAVLPNCLKAEIIMTCNLREWRHFITLRGSKAAHPQIRPIAHMILDELMVHAPNVFSDLLGVFE